MYNNQVDKNSFESVFKLSQAERDAIEQEKAHYEDVRAVAIEALKIVQKYRGWISDNAIIAIAMLLDIPSSDLEEIATFYSQIFRKPVGSHIIRYCDSVVCYITGYQCNKQLLEKMLDIQSGQTTKDGLFTLLPTCCLGNCDKSPVMMIDNKTYTNVKIQDIALLLEKYKKNK
ncbi:NADH-quinone oxidoreductase subunit NuoE [Candidatus Schneideria nysicola]|uniref:NADH-quinone oxidoreductase subunit NuoE n=1 Tax=Candidatus Schneideria nysicola TaxID=1081631 RepID=UPI001CAA5B27|nr:NADH-quinone oxidoreductase subunit NuoE [Candidatus Schneideria nysicola]UAJ65524.1 NADH-quinone oxidoreductase subunit NuoE [Candidatus Schneideria nysicola]UAJ66053.1 NADH-quinone oxidoreductase subunit NuoE [Candidatus Schneideria nysicola]